MPQNSNAWLHYRYWIGILVAIAVELAAFAFAKVPGVGSYLNFALTIGSLLLSGLAIVYAFVSNGSIAQNLGALDEASRRMIESAGTVQVATEQLSAQVSVIPSELNTMSASVRDALAGLSELAVTQSVPSSQMSAPKLVETSINGLLILYGLATALRSSTTGESQI